MILFSKVKVIVILLCVSFVLFSPVFTAYSYSEDDKSVTTDSVVSEDAKYMYNPVGLRDPFAPLVKEIRKSSAKPKRNLGPLEKFQLGQFRLMAMLIVKGTPRAMVKAPNGKSYTVKPGDLIGPNGGVVKSIETKTTVIDEITGHRIIKSPDRVVVEETVVDSFSGKYFKEERYIEM